MRNMWYNRYMNAPAQRQLSGAWPNLYERRDMAIIPHKHCSTCKSEKPLSAFGKKTETSDGLQYQCKSCIAAYNARNAEHKRQAARKWAQGNRERRNERSRYYNKQVHEPVCIGVKVCPRCGIQRQVTEFSVERRRTDGRSIYCKVCIYPQLRILAHRRRLLTDTPDSYTEDQWQALCAFYNQTCLRCGKQKKLTVDHIVPLSLGGTNSIDNIQPLCKSCNTSKGVKVIDYRHG